MPDVKPTSSGFRVRIWCNDCCDTGMGCFDGGTGFLDEEFTTRDQAEKAGFAWACGDLLSYRVEEIK